MKIALLFIGKTKKSYVNEGLKIYRDKLNRFCSLDFIILSSIMKKKISVKEVQKLEGQAILQRILPSDYVVLLDERGKSFTSLKFAKKVESFLNKSTKRILFVVGGAYGFSNEIYNRADEKLSLSSMTFSHQIIRLFFLEQLYRSFTIINNTPYHHE